MIEIGSRRKNQPAPPHVIFEALIDPHRVGARPWLELRLDELPAAVIFAAPPSKVVWSSIWQLRPDAVIEFDLTAGGGGTDLKWTLLASELAPDEVSTRHFCFRLQELINANLRYSFGS